MRDLATPIEAIIMGINDEDEVCIVGLIPQPEGLAAQERPRARRARGLSWAASHDGEVSILRLHTESELFITILS